MKKSKKSTKEKNFYLAIINALRETTNLTKLQKELDISKQNLYYYLRGLKKNGYIYRKERGWYELTDRSKNLTEYGILLRPDFIRGHAYIWNVYFPQEIKDWDKRLEILKQKNIHFKLVGLNIPRIKVLGRKVWLCKNHLRIFDKSSYYGQDAKESRYTAFLEIKSIVGALNNKLGLSLRPSSIHFKKEHYSLIKNDLAIEENKRGNIWRIRDQDGEWLLIDDSLGLGGEIENVGKKSYQTNIKLQKWWNEQKETKFEVTPKFILNTMNGIQQNQLIFDKNMSSHLKVLNEISRAIKELRQVIKQRQTRLGEFI